MKKRIEERLGMDISDHLFEVCLSSARNKLQSIILRFGDADGVRTTPGYLEELVIEAIKSELLSEYTLMMAIM